MYESIPKPPILLRAIPGHLTRVKLRTVGNLTQDEARLVGHLTFVSKRLSEGLKRQKQRKKQEKKNDNMAGISCGENFSTDSEIH